MHVTSDHDARTPADLLVPEIRRFVDTTGAAWARHPELATVPPEEARRIAEEVRRPWTRGGPQMAATTEHVLRTAAGPVRVRRYQPGERGTEPTLVYLHGGGWTLFSLDTHDRIMREYADRAGVAVVGVDYALAPEAKFPVALGQVVGVVRDLAGGAFGTGRGRLAIGGDSVGANLAVAAALSLRDAGESDILAAMLLVYGVFDRRSSPEAIARHGGAGAMLTHAEMEWFWRNYLGHQGEAADPLVSPLRADLHGLPPALLVVPECDLLTEQSLAMADRLRSAGVAASLNLYNGACHSFLEAVSISSIADRAFAESAAWLRGTLLSASA